MADKISVVIPTRNRINFLRAALRCVHDQTWKNVEVIVVDEASSDDTLGMLGHEFPEVKIVRHAVPRGISAARNAGLSSTTGEWIFFLDDDDVVHPRHLEELLVASLDAPPNSIVTGPMRDFHVRNSEIRFAQTFCAPSLRSDADTLNELLEPTSLRTVTHSTILWPRVVFDTIRWDEDLGFNEDFDLLAQAIVSGRHIVGRQAGKYYIRMHSGPRLTTDQSPARLTSPHRYWLKWSAILLPRPDRDMYAPAMRNAMMMLLNEWSGVPIALAYIPQLHQAFKAWGGTRYYVTYPPRSKLKRALLQGLLDFGGPALLRRFLGLTAKIRQLGDPHEAYVAAFLPPTTANDVADVAAVRPYQ